MGTSAYSPSRFKPGHKHSDEVLAKLRRPRPGFTNSGSFKPGQEPHNKKPPIIRQCDACGADMSLAPWQAARGQRFCSKTCAYEKRILKGTFEKGHPDLVPPEKRGHTAATKAKIAQVQRDNPKRGPDNHAWRGGLRSERKQAMGRWEYKEWRKAVFDRDDYTCQICGARGVYIHADHIKPWCAFPDLRYDINNGRTLCVPCHTSLDTHGSSALKYKENNLES